MEKIIRNIKLKVSNHINSEKAYIKRLVFPLKLFPIKLLIYLIYYPLKIVFRFTVAILKILLDTIVFPFKSLKNFLKAIFFIAVTLYMLASFFVIADYLRKNYGWYTKFLCNVGLNDRLRNSVVRVVGGYSEGTGFFIDNDKVLTNFHVIEGEPSPKIILPDGKFEIVTNIIGDSDADMAILTIDKKYPDKVLKLMDRVSLMDEEPLISVGYPMGTDLPGVVTIQKGNFMAYRDSKYNKTSFIQTDIVLTQGMSGGPLVDSCGEVVGINTLGIGGNSLFITSDSYNYLKGSFSDKDVAKISLDPSKSPEDAVRAMYVYLKTRNMEKGFEILSQEYLQKTNIEEWTNRFTDIIDVDVIESRKDEHLKNTVYVKFSTKNWDGQEVDYHYYEGTWQTVLEDGIWKMNKSNIKEIANPSF